jgi:hypothetical protein
MKPFFSVRRCCRREGGISAEELQEMQEEGGEGVGPWIYRACQPLSIAPNSK